MKYDFNVDRMKGKLQINIDKWLYPLQNSLEIHKINGKAYVTYITEVEFVGLNNVGISTGDIVLLSKVACDIATSPTIAYNFNESHYFNVPIEQVIGIFENKEITLNNLKMKNTNILFKRINKNQKSTIAIEEKDTMLGEIIKISESSSLKIGDIVAVRDNVSTPIKFQEDIVYAVEEKFIVGKFFNNFEIENMELLNKYVLMKPYINPYVLNSTILETPNINYDNLDYSDINNRDLFRVYFVDKTLENIQKDDILLVNRDYTNYMYYGNEKYFVINDKKWIAGKIIERDGKCK